VVGLAILARSRGNEQRLSNALQRTVEEDPCLRIEHRPAFNETVLLGLGDLHLRLALEKMNQRFGVEADTRPPRIPYLETISSSAEGHYRHKKQTGGAGQFGEVHLRVEPAEGDFQILNEIFGGAISASYIPAIEKGIRATMKEGIIAGYPVNALKVAVFDGKEHPVDSKPIAFEIAGREAFKIAFKEANPVLLEPIMMVKVIVPESNMGDVLGDMNTRRARVMGMESERGRSTITAHVPLAEMQRYTTQLRSFTGGRGIFTMEFDHYETVPTHLAQEIIAAKQKEDEKND
jgi:elongation factor G